MKRWEYRVEYLARYKKDQERFVDLETENARSLWQQETEERLNELGEDGWELIQLTEDFLENKYLDGYGVFKREKTALFKPYPTPRSPKPFSVTEAVKFLEKTWGRQIKENELSSISFMSETLKLGTEDFIDIFGEVLEKDTNLDIKRIEARAIDVFKEKNKK